MNNIELWEHHGRIMLVDQTSGRGYRGIERAWMMYAYQLGTGGWFRADAKVFEQCARHPLYELMTADAIRALYEQEGQPGAAVNVASCDETGVDVWDDPQSEAAKWYLGDES